MLYFGIKHRLSAFFFIYIIRSKSVVFSFYPHQIHFIINKMSNFAD